MARIKPLQDLQKGLLAVVLGLWRVVAWTSFKLLQATVGGAFTAFILAQIAVAGFCRLICTPRALKIVKAAREAQTAREAAWDFTKAPAAGLPDPWSDVDSVDSEAAKPMHIFPDPAKGHDSLAWQLIGPYMRAYGRHAIANSQLFNPEYVHFFVPGVGSLPYVVSDVYNRVSIFGTGQPLADRVDWRPLTEMFLKEFPGAYFYHVTAEYCEVLQDFGLYINGVGTETTLQVQSWKYSNKTRVVRASARAARESGVRVRELRPEELTEEMRHKLQHDVSGDWLQQKAVADRELRVFVRGVNFDSMELRDGVRIFIAEAYDPAVAPPAYVDPMLQGGAVNAKPPKPPRRTRSKAKLPPAAAKADKSTLSAASRSSSRSSSAHVTITIDDASTHSGTIDSACSGTIGSTGSGTINLVAVSAIDSTSVLSEPSPTSSTSTNTGSFRNATSMQEAGIELLTMPSEKSSEAGVTVGVADAADAKPAAAAAAAAAAAGKPQGEVVGFVLLDPLWEGGEEVGYVTSIMRMKRSAHAGTLKILIEDIISNLRREGKGELTFGFAPLFNIQDGKVFKPYIHWVTLTALYLYHCANNVYAFKNLAYSKSRYGAGLTKDKSAFNDPNVTLTQVYAAYPSYVPGWLILDLYAFFQFIGIIDNPFSVYLKLVGLKKGGENLK